MKKYLSMVVIAIIMFTQNAFALSVEFEIDYYDYLLQEKAITNPNLDMSAKMRRAEFWKTALTLAGYKSDKLKKYYITPIEGIKHDQWYSKYAKEAYRLGLLDKDMGEIDPLGTVRKMEAIEFAFKLFGISTPYYNDLIMDYKDVMNDHPVVSQCLLLDICQGETDKIFGKNKPMKRGDVYEILVKSYIYSFGGDAFDRHEIGSIDILNQMIFALETEYYKPELVDRQELLYGAMNGLAESMGDKYTIFMRPDNSSQYNEHLEGEFEGIGAYVEKDDLGIMIVTPINGSPAKEAGLKANDIVLEADGVILKDMSLEEGISHIKGPKGTTVHLKIQRNGSIMYFDVTRARVNIPSIEAEENGGVLVIKINQFSKNTDELFEKELKDHESIDSIIIDVRSNPGGYLDTAENILSFFIPTGEPIVQIEYPYDNEVTNAYDLNKYKKNIAVLIDDASASASEILAGSLQDYGLATVIGETSFGKGTVQTIEQYFDGSQFKYTIAQWLTAKGNSIQSEGVKPNIKVKDDPDKFGDEALNRALSVLR